MLEQDLEHAGIGEGPLRAGRWRESKDLESQGHGVLLRDQGLKLSPLQARPVDPAQRNPIPAGAPLAALRQPHAKVGQRKGLSLPRACGERGQIAQAPLDLTRLGPGCPRAGRVGSSRRLGRAPHSTQSDPATQAEAEGRAQPQQTGEGRTAEVQNPNPTANEKT